MDDGSDSGKNPDAGFMSQVRALLNASSDSMAVHSLVSLLSEFRALRGCKEQLVKCQSDAAIRERQYDDALNTIAALEARVAKGETNPLNTKVLRLKRGPMDQGQVIHGYYWNLKIYF
uniref:Uncharacterized protein n=1 Tax=Spongospora subterranea TaxID=70186 RepID=A0A0H5R8J4_9EUKA|eukprot:CRZ04674.1 hypothetical protein [Spongospora subterranea]